MVNGQQYFVSLDATDCPIEEPLTQEGATNPSYYSHKLKGAGLKYEIGLCIRTGNIVWVHGGVPCGDFSDLTLARSMYLSFVDDGELTVADDGYVDPHFIYPRGYPQLSIQLKAISQRHETINKHIKTWRILSTPFRHEDLTFHRRCFYAVANIIQLMISMGELTLYQINDVNLDL